MATAPKVWRATKQRARSMPDLTQFVTFEGSGWLDEGGSGSGKAVKR